MRTASLPKPLPTMPRRTPSSPRRAGSAKFLSVMLPMSVVSVARMIAHDMVPASSRFRACHPFWIMGVSGSSRPMKRNVSGLLYHRRRSSRSSSWTGRSNTDRPKRTGGITTRPAGPLPSTRDSSRRGRHGSSQRL